MTKLRYRGPDTDKFKCGGIYTVSAAAKARGLDPEVWQIVAPLPEADPKPVSEGKAEKAPGKE